MNVQVTFRNLEPSDALRDAATSALEGASRYLTHMESARAIFSVEDKQHRAELIVHGDGADVVAHDAADDMYRALTNASEHLATQLRKRHDKRSSDRS